MTFEEISLAIEGMLAVQRELQEGQFRLQSGQINLQEGQINLQTGLMTLREEQAELTRREGVLIDEMTRLIEVSNRHENRINQLIGYSITGDSDRLTLLERLMNVEKRLERLEIQQNGNL